MFWVCRKSLLTVSSKIFSSYIIYDIRKEERLTTEIIKLIYSTIINSEIMVKNNGYNKFIKEINFIKETEKTYNYP